MSVLRRWYVPDRAATSTAPKRRVARGRRRAPAPVPVTVVQVDDTLGMVGDMLDIVLPTVRRLAHEHKTAVIAYVGTNGVETEREIEPYREWQSGSGNTMLTAWCLRSNAVRTFDLARVKSVREGAPFEPRGDIDIPTPDDHAEDPTRRTDQ